MSNPLNPIAVVNFFVGKAVESGDPASPMKLIKLVYVAHGWHLGLTGEPLIDEPIEAWKYGPVIKKVYHSLKPYGSDPVTSFEGDFVRGSSSFTVPTVEDEQTKELLDKVWEGYGKYTAVQLSSMTHMPGTPWDMVWNGMGGKNRESAEIPNEIIRAYYAARVAKSKETVKNQ